MSKVVENDLNAYHCSGNVGADARYYDKGSVPIARFSLGVNTTVDGTPKPTWIQAVCFGSMADLARKWVSKGRKLVLTGRWHDNHKVVEQTVELPDGSKVTGKCSRIFQELIVTKINFMDKKPGSNDYQDDPDYEVGTGAADEEIPF